MSIDATDRRIIAATSGGLPLTPAPYAEVAGWLDLTEAEVLDRIGAMQASGVIRHQPPNATMWNCSCASS